MTNFGRVKATNATNVGGSIRGSVWDLDQTLISTDTFAEQVTGIVIRRPWLLVLIAVWLIRGRGYCKGRVATLGARQPDSWPVRTDALQRIASDRAEGRMVVLATGAHRDVAGPIAAHLGCFDVVLATSDFENLKAGRKACAIAKLAAAERWVGFCYAGDCYADIAVWQQADEIVVVDPTPRLLRRLRRLGKPLAVLGSPQSGWAAIIKACRPHQWAKNLLLFVPIVLAQRIEPVGAGHVVIAFFAFSLCASGVYLMNDIGDIAADREHPRKRRRPFASGRLSIFAGLRLAACLFAAGAYASIRFLPEQFVWLLALYVVANVAYCCRLKQVPVLDVLMLACMYALRLEAGAVATNLQVSDWLLTFSLFFFTSLAFAKRYTELRRLDSTGGVVAAGRGYDVSDIRLLETLGAASGYVSVLVLALYMNSEQMRMLYGDSRMLWLVCPLVLFWITRLWLLANRGQLDEDPVVFAISDRLSLAVGAACGTVLLLSNLFAKVPP
jgi:4-hydroxybenzoate polyprenyltransferase